MQHIYTEGEVVVAREYLISLLQAWKDGKITAADVYETATILYGSHGWRILDWEGNEEYSVTIDVLENLESLNVDSFTRDDIDPTLEFLHTPLGQYEEGNKKWQQYSLSIDYEERARVLGLYYPYPPEGPRSYDVIVVTRESLISLLQAWKEDKITAADVYETAKRLCLPQQLKVLDLEGPKISSVTRDILGHLKLLNANLITREDIEPAIEFLRTPLGQYEEGYKRWQRYKGSIDYEDRAERLKGQAPYLP